MPERASGTILLMECGILRRALQVESPSKSAGMFDSLSGLTNMLQVGSMPAPHGARRAPCAPPGAAVSARSAVQALERGSVSSK